MTGGIEMQTESIPSHERVFDLDAVLEMVDGELELVQQLAEMLIEELPGQSARLREGVAGNNPQLVERVTHRLKSSVGNLGGRRAQSALRELELLARTGDVSAGTSQLARCQSELCEFQTVLQRFLVH